MQQNPLIAILRCWKFFAEKFRCYTANIYLLKVNNKNSKKWCKICSKLTIKAPKRRQSRRSGVFIVNFEHISQLFSEFLLLTLNKLILNASRDIWVRLRLKKVKETGYHWVTNTQSSSIAPINYRKKFHFQKCFPKADLTAWNILLNVTYIPWKHQKLCRISGVSARYRNETLGRNGLECANLALSANFTGKHLCWSLFFRKLQTWRLQLY